MDNPRPVLVVGGTGRTGARVVHQLLERGFPVRVIVRSVQRLPDRVAGDPNLAVTEADLLSLADADLERHVSGCDAVISCLGHVTSIKGVFGPPRDLVERAARRLCRAIEATAPERPVRYILMSSVSVTDLPGAVSKQPTEAVVRALTRAAIPPARDNQRAADFLAEEIGVSNRSVQWVAVRPDTLREGDLTEYVVHEHIVASLFKPDDTNMANVAHFMVELVSDDAVWDRWQGKRPVVVNAGDASSALS